MAENILKGLIGLITSNDSAEVRRAAVRVVGALKPSKERGLNQALIGALEDQDTALRCLAAEALGEAKAEEALPQLVRFVENGGPEVDAAVRAIGHLGARGTKALGRVMNEATPVLRRRIAAALALAGTESAVLATAETLLDEDQGVVEASAKSLATEVPLLSAGQKRILAEHLRAMLSAAGRRKNKAAKRRPPAPPHQSGQFSAPSEAAILRVLAAMHAPEAENLYWARLDRHHAASLRAAALQALSALPLPTGGAKLEKLFGCAAAEEFQVVAPALMLLKKVPATRKDVKHWLALFKAPDVAAHLLAVEKLRQVDTGEVAKSLLAQLQHPDKGLREQALAALSTLKSGREALFTALLQAPTPEEAWKLARAQAEAAKEWPTSQRAKVFALACKAHESEDRRADALWHILSAADRDSLRGKIEERAHALRKKKNYASSLAYWRLLARDPSVGSELRFELAATALKVSTHDISAAARESDPALEHFNRLLQDPGFDLFAGVRSATWLQENDLFYLGFHFAEQQRLGRDFGRKVLELVIQRWPKSPLAKNAKRKLGSEGLS